MALHQDTRVAKTRDFLERILTFVDEAVIYPRANIYLDVVLLALLSKSLTVGRAVCVLAETGFPDEAFGLSRTLIDLYLTVRYISNRDQFVRAERFARFTVKEKEGWNTIYQKYYGKPATADLARLKTVLDEAKEYKNPNWWTGLGGHTREMACEGDALETDASGKPATAEFDYEVMFKWTSHYVHPTASAIDSHAVLRGQRFSVHARKGVAMDVSGMALFNTSAQTYKVLLRVWRELGRDVPDEIGLAFATLSKTL